MLFCMCAIHALYLCNIQSYIFLQELCVCVWYMQMHVCVCVCVVYADACVCECVCVCGVSGCVWGGGCGWCVDVSDIHVCVCGFIRCIAICARFWVWFHLNQQSSKVTFSAP